MPPEAVERLKERAVRKRSEAGNAHVDAHCRSGLRNGLCYLALGLDADKPLAARETDGDVLHCAEHLAAVAVAQPSQLGQEDTTVALVGLDLFRVWETETVATALLLGLRETGAFLEKVLVGPLQILERLLQGLAWRFVQPERLRLCLPLGEHLAQSAVAKLLLTALVTLFLEVQRLVVDEAARTGEAAHEAILLAAWHQFVAKRLAHQHGYIIIGLWQMIKI